MKKLVIFSSIIIMMACNNAAPESQSATTFDVSATKSAIDSTNRQFEQAFVRGDSAAIVAMYHPEAKLFPPNMEPCNRNALGSMVLSIPKTGIKKFKLNTAEVSGGPDEVVETGSFEMSDSLKMVDKGSYIAVWKKDGDAWKLYRDIWNSSTTQMPAK